VKRYQSQCLGAAHTAQYHRLRSKNEIVHRLKAEPPPESLSFEVGVASEFTMSKPRPETLLQHLRRVIGAQEPSAVSDATLLDHFVASADEAAFELLLWRHGPMVLGVCCRLLGREQDAEDAFQATFLVLVRKARSIGKRESLGSWLFRVAYRIALRARALRGKHERVHALFEDVAASPESQEALWHDLRSVLDEEVERLPERYRRLVVLCYLQGKTNDEAARLLGCSRGTVAARLSRARLKLRERLVRRGITLSAGSLAGLLTSPAVATTLSADLVNDAVRAASALAAGKSAVISASTLTLVEGGLAAMNTIKLKVMAGLFMALLVVGGGVGLIAHGAAEDAPAPEEAAQAPNAQAANAQAREAQAPAPNAPAAPNMDQEWAERLKRELIQNKPDVRKLAVARVEAAHKLVDARMKAFLAGKVIPVDFLLDASRRLRDAELALAGPKKQRIAALERHWLLLKKVEEIDGEKFRAGSRGPIDYYPILVELHQAERDLVEAMKE
jgi:RNA polymerase sigma factor (sigma-70 family)